MATKNYTLARKEELKRRLSAGEDQEQLKLEFSEFEKMQFAGVLASANRGKGTAKKPRSKIVEPITTYSQNDNSNYSPRLQELITRLENGELSKDLRSEFPEFGKWVIAGHAATVSRRKNLENKVAPSIPEVKTKDYTESTEEDYSGNGSSTSEGLTDAQSVAFLRDGCSPNKIARYFKGTSEGRLRAQRAHIQMNTYDNNPDLLKKKVPKPKKIDTKEELVPFLKENKPAQDLSLLALSLGANGGEIEEALLHLYDGKFKNREELHQLLEDSRADLAELIEGGITNLGMFIGSYTLPPKGMMPIIFGGAIESFPIERSTPTLKKMLTRVASGIYDPLFNKDPKKTISDLEGKARAGPGLANEVYSHLAKSYQEALGYGDYLFSLSSDR